MKITRALLPKEKRVEWLRWVMTWILVIFSANVVHTIAISSKQRCLDPRLCGVIRIANRLFCLVCDEPDSPSYIYPWLNWLNHGTYWEDCRTPAYGAPYFFLYLFSPSLAPFGVYALQVVGLAILYASLMTYAGDQLGRIGRIALFATLSIIPLTFYYSRVLLTEALTATLVGIGVLALQSRYYFLAGLCISITAMMKPVYFILFPLQGGYLFLIERDLSFIARLRQITLYGLPLLFTVAPWTLRNWIRYGDLRPAHGSGTTDAFSILSDDLLKARLYFSFGAGLAGFRQANECLALPEWVLRITGKRNDEMKHLLFSPLPLSCEEKLKMANTIDSLWQQVQVHYGPLLIVLRVWEVYKSLVPIPSHGYWCNLSNKRYIFLSLFYLSGLCGAILALLFLKEYRLLPLSALGVTFGYALVGRGGYRYWEPIIPLLLTSTLLFVAYALSKVKSYLSK
ncbi:MAG: hypothetical protein RMJ49_08035 [Bacteroidia bacterium]|nr:hypothetical protein [Bacteroidia bacterium]